MEWIIPYGHFSSSGWLALHCSGSAIHVVVCVNNTSYSYTQGPLKSQRMQHKLCPLDLNRILAKYILPPPLFFSLF